MEDVAGILCEFFCPLFRTFFFSDVEINTNTAAFSPQEALVCAPLGGGVPSDRPSNRSRIPVHHDLMHEKTCRHASRRTPHPRQPTPKVSLSWRCGNICVPRAASAQRARLESQVAEAPAILSAQCGVGLCVFAFRADFGAVAACRAPVGGGDLSSHGRS